jgi:DNA-binding HxlR family transcriptional regulator
MASTPREAQIEALAAKLPGGSSSLCDSETYELTKELLGQVADRWTLLVVGVLSEGPQRFSALQAVVVGISHRMLSKTLRCLLRDGMVTRTAYAEIPPRVEYELTELGWKLIDLARGFADWTESHGQDVRTNREQFDRERVDRER